MTFFDFVVAQVPAGSGVLEIGCGEGALALELAEAGFDVLAIDPVAPDGAVFRRMAFEELDDPGPFDAVVASLSLHHVHELDAALDRIVELLAPGGVLVLDEFSPSPPPAGRRRPRRSTRCAPSGRRGTPACTATRRCGAPSTRASTSAPSPGSRTSTASSTASRPRRSSAR